MKKFNESFPELDNIYTRLVCTAIAFLLVFAFGNFCGGLTNISSNGTLSLLNNTAAPAENSVQNTAASITQPTTAAADTQTAAPVVSAGTSSSMTADEIVALFNQSADKVKTNAVKVVKNFEKKSTQTEKTVVPSALEGTANSLMEKFMQDDLEPIEYASKEEIAANYPVPGQSYSSKLTTADVKEASCTDNGTEYEITLKLNDTQNPTAGVGVGAACDVIESEEVTSSSVGSMLKSFNVNYYDCVIKCKIDKASGHLTWASYTTPVVIDCQVNVVFSTVDATVGLTFEKDYSVSY